METNSFKSYVVGNVVCTFYNKNVHLKTKYEKGIIQMKIYNEKLETLFNQETGKFNQGANTIESDVCNTPLNFNLLNFAKADIECDALNIPFRENEQIIEDLQDLIFATGEQNGLCMTDNRFANFSLWVDMSEEIPTYQLGITAYPLWLTKKEQEEHIQIYGDEDYCWSSFFFDTDKFYSNQDWQDDGKCEFYNIEFEPTELNRLQQILMEYCVLQ